MRPQIGRAPLNRVGAVELVDEPLVGGGVADNNGEYTPQCVGEGLVCHGDEEKEAQAGRLDDGEAVGVLELWHEVVDVSSE